MIKRDTLAKIVRVISVPPIVASCLFTTLFVKVRSIFTNIYDFVMTIFCIGVFPAISYFVHLIIPVLRKTGRRGQRKLAFIFSGIGYVILFVYSNVKSNCTLFFKQISGTYITSFCILAVFDKFLKFKMSGHAASISAPIIFSAYHLGILSSILCSILFLLVFWASIKTRRHTILQFLSGSICSVISFYLSVIINK